MTVVNSYLALHLLPLLPLLLLLLVATNEGTTFNITNQCSYTVWPAAVPGGGMQLDPEKSWTLDVPANATGGRMWARTGCSFDDKGNGSCQTGDCSGMLACKGYGQPPSTLAEFSRFGIGQKDYFHISLVYGFNVPMDFQPVPTREGPGCSKGPRCTANITSQCPSELTVPGGCNNACTVFKQEKYCCLGNTCEPNNTYSVFFGEMCPDASNAGLNNMFACPQGTNYQVIFCPPFNLTSSPPILPTLDASEEKSIESFMKKARIIIWFFLGSRVVCLIIFAVIFFSTCKRPTQQHQELEEVEVQFAKLQGTPKRFTFQQLEVATEQFREKLGEGGFGSVFRGQLGEERIAVKRLDRAGQGKREFLAEVQTIGSIHHINLVRLIGFCAEKSQRLLVYEYMPKGSLDRWIYSQHDNNTPLDWRMRCKIITHIAKGLSYLHEECKKRIVHLDVKPQNILLDDNFNAKISDFGLCKLIDRDKSQVITRMRGTPGYLAPEWLASQITEKADVYSFGVVVMEIISGRKNIDTSRSEESIHLITLLEEKVKSENLVDLIDKHSNDMQVHKQEVIQMMTLAMWCLQIDCKRRPKMSEVIKVLVGTMNAETNIDHNFVATNASRFYIAGNVSSSAPPLASDLSGPR